MRARASIARPVIAVLATALSLAACATAAPGPPEPVDGDPRTPVVHAEPPDAHAQADYARLVAAANDKALAGELDAARRLADEALRLRAFGLEAGVVKVEAHLGLGQRTAAVDFAERLRARHATRGEAHYAYGKALYALGRLTAAQDAFAEGLTHAPDDPLLLLGHLTALAHDPSVPLRELQARADELLDGSARDGYVLNALAMAHELRGDNAAADALYVRAIAARPLHPFAHYNLALLRQSDSGIASARPHFQAFLEQAPPSATREVEAVKKLLEENPE